MFNGIQPQKVLHLPKELAKKKPNLLGEFIITEKLDGWYVQIPFIVGLGWQTPLSSALRAIPAFEWVAQYLNTTSLKPKVNCIIIAEAIIPDTPFHILNGKFNRSVGDYACKDVEFVIHDFLVSGRPETAYARIGSVSYLNEEIKTTNIKILRMAEAILVSEYNESLWQKSFETIIDRGGEGIIAKRVSGYYQAGKRNSDLLKLKLEATFDLLCKEVYWTEGEKGNANMNLRLVRASGTEVTVRVGKHSDIAKFTEESPVGKVAEVRCMKELPDGTLREPRFAWIREDKLAKDID